MPLARRILGLALLNLVLIAVVLAIFAERQFGLSLEALLLGPAHDRIAAIATSFGRDLDSTDYNSRYLLLEDYSQRYGIAFLLVDVNGQSLSATPAQLPEALLPSLRGRPEGPGPPMPKGPPGEGGFPPPRGRPPATFLKVTHNPLSYWVGVRIPTSGPLGERGIPGVLLLRTDSIFNSQLFLDWRAVLLLAFALVAIAVACWWPFLRGVTAAIRQMDRATDEIAHGRFDRHVTIRRSDELGHLGEHINAMAGRLEAFVKHQKRFLGDIAHELCAPLARVQFALGILEQRADEAQQTHVAVLREEIQEMSALINELLQFSKAGVQPDATPLKPLELAPLVERAVAHQLPGAGTIESAVDRGLMVIGHEAYLVRAISNLLRNAIRYAGDAGPIHISARREGDRVLLSVSDCGPGLPEGTHDEIFAPFYRPEAARSRDTGGVGLGLAIVKSCVEACRGSVTCRNREPSGLEVTIALPAAHAA